MQISQQALVDEVCLYYFLHCASRTQNQVSLTQIVNQFTGNRQFLTYLIENSFKALSDLILSILEAVNYDESHLLVWLNKTVIFILKTHDLCSIIFPQSLKNRGRNSVELSLNFTQTINSSSWQLSKSLHICFGTIRVSHKNLLSTLSFRKP